ncbi:4'-phosphopantetheinyl transferase family protein [Ferruginibacter sp. SUN002]|uniref:4'-phosphopantetheinyl transferase family protein n=1 Tax=Ferruginibacter sp. SUN002 TaxID=2937789 RepID=UPI003D35E798
MPLVYQQNINEATKLAIWHITESEDFFLLQVPLQRSITHPHKRLQHLAGRFLLKELFPDFPHSLIQVADTRKPFLVDEAYHFSISHCGDFAAAIVSTKNRVGVDIELYTDKVERVKHKYLSEAEQILLQNSNTTNDLPLIQLLTSAWSIKETIFKWEGKGELDFKEHMQIRTFDFKNLETATASCILSKYDAVSLNVEVKFFSQLALAWCVK